MNNSGQETRVDNAANEIYALRPERVQAGDVVLTSSQHLISSGIRVGTQSQFSHAALCTRQGMLLEATLTGVMRYPILGVYATRREWLKVLRPTRPMTVDQQAELTIYAEGLYGRGYSILGALLSPFGVTSAITSTGIFCSQLAARAYAELGRPIVLGLDPNSVTPAALAASPELDDVSDKCVRVVTSVEPIYEHIIQASENAPHSDEMRMNRQVFKAIRTAIGEVLPESIGSLPEAYTWLVENASLAQASELAGTVLALLEREKFFAWYEEWSDSRGKELEQLELLAGLVERVQSISNEEQQPLRRLLRDLEPLNQLDEEVLRGRLATAKTFRVYATETKFALFEVLAAKYEKEYSFQEKFSHALGRLAQALQELAQ